MSVQKIRLPSVNDIFPQPQMGHMHHRQSYPQTQAPMPLQPQSHMTQSSHALLGMGSQSSQHQQQHPQPPIVGPPSPLNNNGQAPPQHYEIRSPMPVYYYQPVYYTHQPNTPPPMYPASTASPAHSPIYAPHPSMQQAYRSSVYVDMKYRVQKLPRQSNAWTDEDDTLLKYLKEVRNLGWREISMHFRNRTANGCQFRWRRITALAKTVKEKEIDDEKLLDVSKKRENSLEKLLN